MSPPAAEDAVPLLREPPPVPGNPGAHREKPKGKHAKNSICKSIGKEDGKKPIRGSFTRKGYATALSGKAAKSCPVVFNHKFSEHPTGVVETGVAF